MRRDVQTLQLYRPNVSVRSPSLARDVWDICQVGFLCFVLVVLAYLLMGDLSTPVAADMQWLFTVVLLARIGAMYSTSSVIVSKARACQIMPCRRAQRASWCNPAQRSSPRMLASWRWSIRGWLSAGWPHSGVPALCRR